jgi:hypothetical protein
MDNTTIIINAVGIIGTVASLLGAYLSIKAKIAAKSSAEIAESAKNQVLKKQKTTNLSEILFEAKRVQQSFRKYSITQNKSLIGAEFEKDAEVLQTFIFSFNENRALLEASTEIETDSAYKTLNEQLDNFTKNKIADDKKTFGKQIRLAIDDIIFKLRKVIDNRNSEIE